MKSQRRSDECERCGEIRELAARGLCYRCYRNEAREKERRERPVDRHNPGIRREHKVLFRAHANVMAGLTDLKVSRDDIMEIKGIIEPYLEPIQQYLNAVNSEQATKDVHGDKPVNSEQRNEEFTVQPEPVVPTGGGVSAGGAGVNGEHKESNVHGHSSNGYKVGDSVTFTHRKTGGLHTGKLTSIKDDFAYVSCGVGRPFKLTLAELKVVQ